MRSSLLAAVAAAALTIVTPASAATVMQFIQDSASAQIFSYKNVTSGAVKAKLSATGGAVTLSGLHLFPSADSSVFLNATSTALPTFTSTGTSQLFSGSMTFKLLAPRLGLSGPSVNALTVNFANASFLAGPGSMAASLQSTATSTVSFSSDFVDFSGGGADNFSLSFSGASRTLARNGSRLPNFSMSGVGTFAAPKQKGLFAAAVPEPGVWVMMLGGVGMMGAALRRRRSGAAQAEA